MIALAGVLAAFFATFFHPYSNAVLTLYYLLAALAFHDGFLTAKRINRDYVPWQHAVAFYFAWILYLCGFYLLLYYVGSNFGPLELRVARDNRLAPALKQDERFLLDRASYWFRSPRVGEVVAYRIADLEVRFVLDAVVNNTVAIHEDVYNRIVAGPGETFERRGGVYLRNGRPVAQSEAPLMHAAPPDFKLVAPSDHYIILLDPQAPFIYQASFDFKVFKLEGTAFKGRYEITNWEQVCVVPRKAIKTRAWIIYNPPPARRWVH